MGRPPFIGVPCGTPNGLCIEIKGIEILIAIALIIATIKLYQGKWLWNWDLNLIRQKFIGIKRSITDKQNTN